MAETPRPPLNIYQRMIQVQKAVQTVYKNDTVKMSENDKGYKATSHDDVAALLHLPLAEAGIVVLPEVLSFTTSEVVIKGKYGDRHQFRTDLNIRVRWINSDNPDDFFESHSSSFALDSSDKGFAKAYSLAMKICLLKVHLLESRDGEEQRDFEREDEQAKGRAQTNNRPPPNQPKHSAIKPAASNEGAKIEQPTRKGNPGPGNPAASDETLVLLDDTMRERGIQPDDVSYWLTKGHEVDLTIPKPVSEKLAKELIDLMGLEGFTAQNLRQDADEMALKRKAKAEVAGAKSAKAEANAKKSFVMPIGSEGVKGKELSSLSLKTLGEIRDWTDGEMKKQVTPKKRAELFEINSQVREEIKGRS